MSAKEDAAHEIPVSNYFQSFESENRGKRRLIVSLAVAVFLSCMAALVGTMQSVGSMNAQVVHVFEAEGDASPVPPILAKANATAPETSEEDLELAPEDAAEVSSAPVEAIEP